MKDHQRSAMAAAVLGNGIFGFSFMFSRIALGTAHPYVMLMHRFDITFVLLLVIALCFGKRSGDTGAEIDWLRFDLKGRSLLPLLGMGIIQPVGYFLCESFGISMTNSTFAGVMIAMIPIAATAGGVVLLHEIPKPRQIAFSLLSIAGVVLMTVRQNAQGEIRPLGVLLLLGAVLTGAYFSILSRQISDRYSTLERTVVMMGVAAVSFTCLGGARCGWSLAAMFEPLTQVSFLGSMVYLAICSSIIAFLSLNYSNNYLPVARTTVFANLTTVISLFAGVIFLHESFGVLSLIASAMILIGIRGAQKG